MSYFFHICVSLCLIIFQTTVIPYIPLFHGFYDLLSPFVIYLSIFRSSRESIPVILFFGFVMDNIYGGPFGLYLTTYLWLFVGVRWIITFLHVGNSLLWPFVVVAGVLMENFIFVVSSVLLKAGLHINSVVLGMVGVQVLWAVFTGPVLISFFNYLFGKWNQKVKVIFAK